MVVKKQDNNIVNISPDSSRISNVNQDSPLNIVFLGKPGAGKSTAIKNTGGDMIFSGDLKNKKLNKGTIKIGIDYCECFSDSGHALRFYTTPGQKRYNNMHFSAVLNAHIYIILIDLTSVAPFAEFMHHKKTINVYGNEEALQIVAFTHFDRREHDIFKLSKKIRHKCYGEVLTTKIDVRNHEEVQFMIEKLICLILGDKSPKQYYAENDLFLKNINRI